MLQNNATLYQRIEEAIYKHRTGDLAEVITEIIDESDHMTLQQLDNIARNGDVVEYKGVQYTIKRLGYEYTFSDCDKAPYAELLDVKTGRCAVYAKVKDIVIGGKNDKT